MLVTMIWNGIEHKEVIYAFIVVPYKQKHLWDQIDRLSVLTCVISRSRKGTSLFPHESSMKTIKLVLFTKHPIIA